MHLHQDSFQNLLGEDWENKKSEFALETRVNTYTPATFIWGTFEDSFVPVQNSLLFVNALAEYKIPTEYHMFQKGEHGLGTSTYASQGKLGPDTEPAAAEWIRFVHMWLENRFSI